MNGFFGNALSVEHIARDDDQVDRVLVRQRGEMLDRSEAGFRQQRRVIERELAEQLADLPVGGV